MKAFVYREYGSSEVLKLEEVERPTPKEGEVLIEVRAVSPNASDFEMMRGTPVYTRMWGLRRPRIGILGSDLAGRIASVGPGVCGFEAGDEVLVDNFDHWGGLAEYACAPAKMLVKKPASMSFETAAALPQPAVIALQAIRDRGKVQAGQTVLINGAGGGAGTFAIQLAKRAGAEVTAVDGAHKLQLMGDLGADHVVDYAAEDCTRSDRRYDFILDLVGHHSVLEFRRVLAAGGTYAMVGGSVPLILSAVFLGGLISRLGSRKMGVLGIVPNAKDLGSAVEQVEAGKLKPAIDQCFPFEETPEAMRRLANGEARGNVVISVGEG